MCRFVSKTNDLIETFYPAKSGVEMLFLNLLFFGIEHEFTSVLSAQICRAELLNYVQRVQYGASHSSGLVRRDSGSNVFSILRKFKQVQ